MYQFDFYLSIKQIQDVMPSLEEAEKKFYDEGEKGAVFCQVYNSRVYPGKVTVSGAFIPGKYAVKIQAVLNEYYVSIGLDPLQE